jgi:hypothetical protein
MVILKMCVFVRIVISLLTTLYNFFTAHTCLIKYVNLLYTSFYSNYNINKLLKPKTI